MKENRDKTKLFMDSESNIPNSELDKNQEFDKSEYVEDNFYSLMAEDLNHLLEGIKRWEADRFMI